MTMANAPTAEAGAWEYWMRSERAGVLSTIEGQVALTVASAELAAAVAALLDDQGLIVSTELVCATSAGEGCEVRALAAHHPSGPVLIPIVPGNSELLLYGPFDDSAVTDLVATVTVPPELIDNDGWIPAAAIAHTLRSALEYLADIAAEDEQPSRHGAHAAGSEWFTQ